MNPRGTEHVVDGPQREAVGLVHRLRRASMPPPSATIVMLHGRHGDEDAMWPLRAATPDGWLLVAPRGPVADPAGGFAWVLPGRRRWPELADFELAVEAVAQCLRALPELYGADPDRLFLLGFSQGAAAALATAIAHPRLVRGVGAIVGFVPADCSARAALRPLAGVPVFLATGRRDPLVPLARSRACQRSLLGIGADVTYREYNAGHRLSTQGMRDLRDWWPESP